jgi:PcfJ-like protein
VNRNRTEDIRKHYERRRQEAAARRVARAQAQSLHEQALRAALSRYAARTVPHREEDGDAMQIVFRRAPRLAVEPYAGAVRRLVELHAVRPVGYWTPAGKGRDRLFRSLAEHLLAEYPMPALLWTAFFDDEAERLAPLVAHVASGASFFDCVKTAFPVPLTRRMCHEILSMPCRGTLLQAIRKVQVRSAGGDESLYQAWIRTREGRSIGDRVEEAFWWTVIEWFSRTTELDASQVAPLVDYIGNRRRQDARFSMAGRSLSAMIRAMKAWHGELATEKTVQESTFPLSGFVPAEFDRSSRDRDGQFLRRVWRVDEIRSTKELAAEGHRMNHCVYSYAPSIQNGQASIWSMTLEDGRGKTGRWAMLTIEVRNATRAIVQARGRFNRAATSEEHSILMAWAGMNDLRIVVGQWG